MNSVGRPKGMKSNKEFKNGLAKMIGEGRMNKGMGLKDLGINMDLSLQFISNIENGRAGLPWEHVNKIAKVLDLSPSTLALENLKISDTFKKYSEILENKEVA